MESNRTTLKVISIAQIAMTAILFVLAMVDRFEVRFISTSFLFMPCWIAGLVLPAGIMGLILAYSSRPSSALVNAQSSVSLASAVVSAVAVFYYGLTIRNVHADKLHHSAHVNYFVGKDFKPEFTDHDNTAMAISSLIAIFCIIEIALAIGGANSGESCYQYLHENQPGTGYSQIYQPNHSGDIQIPLQPASIDSQPMSAVQVPSYN